MTTALSARRWAVVLAAALSGVLVLVSMLVDPAPSAEGRELIQGYSEDTTASGLHTNLIHYGFALFLPVAFAVVGLVRGRGAWLANVAALFAVIGLSTLPGLVLLDFTSVAAALETDLDTASAIQERMDELGWFLAIAVPAFLTSVLAVPLAALAAWRAGLFPWWVPVAAFVAMVAPNALPWHVGFVLMALGMLVVAHALWRVPLERWHQGPAVEG